MKKSLLALAVLGAFAGAASAQSSVTLYGTIDLNARYVKNDGSERRYSMGQDGINSSQLGFRGVEDLGGGLKASFVLLAGVNADTGTTNSKFFNRRSTVSLSGGFGEIRLGRDYTPTFWNNTNFDPFGTNGVGDSTHVMQIASNASYGTDVTAFGINNTFVRADNAIQYFLPALGGFYGQFMAAAAEGTTGGVNPGRYIGGRVGFATGPFDIAIAAAQQKLATAGSDAKKNTYNIGGSYDFGVVKLMGYFNRDNLNDFASEDIRENRFSVGAVVPLGQFEIHASYSRSKIDNLPFVDIDSNKSQQWALGGVYNLSKRTAFYGTYSRITNGDIGQNSVSGGGSITALPTSGDKSVGAEFGVRHFF